MNEILLLMGFVILICILLNGFLEKIPVPSLLIFIALGMLFGENGLLRISFDDYAAVNVICSVSLIFIMFYGGFGTNLHTARPVLVPATLMSTLGVAGTAGAVALFARAAFGIPWAECFLIGGVISSTDAASVFNILRSQKLALKYHTDSLLEIESGSNDPMSYMLTTVAICLLSGQPVSIPLLLFRQLSVGIVCGIAMGWVAVRLLHRQLLPSQQSHTIFLLAIMFLAYALPSVCGGNGYLSVYLCGIWIGNSNLPQKKYLVHFFDVLTHVAQMLIFFLLGLLVTPARLPSVLLPALAVTVFLTLVARPAVTALVLGPFRPTLGQIGMVSWAGLRGAASIVFAIAAVLSGVQTTYNLYNLVFCIVLLSISIQGTLLPWVARKLAMIDHGADVGRTFTDYQEDSDIDFIKLHVDDRHPWKDRELRDLQLPPDLLVAMILRDGGMVIPTGKTRIEAGDLMVLAARSFEDNEHLVLREVVVEPGHRWAHRSLSQIPQANANRVILVKRGIDTLIPSGNTVLEPGDILVMVKSVAAVH
ncbi:MAG: potassium/proton antiporter [Gemmiger sp.]|uniref:potassium/proton antiporter n=1 Tax=Gemmiger sp. TaxID=2049027 RepID=UPI002E79B4FC|nr:potassium/proton antiporter [Gemmiger sp.]MEE0800521.1 potassium/proton antiporter [Gemmiger sp.]